MFHCIFYNDSVFSILVSGYSRLLAELSSPSFTGADSFYVRVNLDLCHHSDPPCLRVCCDDVLHVTDTRYNGKYQWRCVRVDKHTGAPLQAGAVPNYNRYIMHAIHEKYMNTKIL